jgi:hypothetical protein
MFIADVHKLVIGVNDTGDILLPVSLTPVNRPQSEHLVKNNYMRVNSNSTVSQQNMKKNILGPGSKFFSFIAGFIDTSDQPLLTNICANFVKIRNCLNDILRGPGETDSKKLKLQISCQTPLKK